jgi:DeoR/GlpR family transcriptional regulator of sugar metabolism
VTELAGSGMIKPPIVLGGRYRPSGGCFVGPLTVSTLRQFFRLDLAFIGVTGVNEAGFYAADMSEVQVKTELVDRAERIVVPMDHSKIGLADFITSARSTPCTPSSPTGQTTSSATGSSTPTSNSSPPGRNTTTQSDPDAA